MIVEQKALEQMKEWADKDPRTAYEIGEYYYTQGDYKESVEWYKKATARNNPYPLALFALGYAYQTGQGASVDLMQSLHYYEAAASMNVPQAFYNLAYFYQNGLGVERSQERADHYVLRAAECLKSLSEELFEAKKIQEQVLARYDDAVQSVARKSDEWMRVSRECAEQKEQQAFLRSRIEALGEKNEGCSSRLAQLAEELTKKDATHKLLLQTHQQVLTLVDEQRSELLRAKWINEEAKSAANQQKKQCDVLTACISQKDNEIKDILQLQTESQRRLLAFQKDLIESQEKLKMKEAELETAKARISKLDETVAKLTRARLKFFLILIGVLGLALLEGVICLLLYTV